MIPLLLLLGSAVPEDAVVALIMVDRFADADDDDADVDDVRAWQGGDLRGLKRHLADLHDLGVTHVWLTPLHKQIDHPVGKTVAYHGYWPEQLDAVDPHFGTIEDLRDVAAEA